MAEQKSVGRVEATFSFLNIVPLIAFPVAMYFVITFSNGGSSDWLQSVILPVQLMSDDIWNLTVGDLFVGLSLLLLFIEIIKSTQTGAAAIINHGLSMGLTLICVLMFVTMKGYGTSEFFFLTLMQALDVVAGFTITIVGARRDLGTGSIIGGP